MQSNLKVVFFGTPEFAVPALQSLLDADFEVAAVITRPDKPVGRKQILTPPPVKIIAQKNNIKVFQPVTLRQAQGGNVMVSSSSHGVDIIYKIKKLNPDLFVIVAYGKILPQALLDIPRHGSINIHPSLLPKYRGPSPLQATLLSDDKETGVCLMLIDEEMDHGPILASYKMPVTKNHNAESLGNELFELGARHLPQVIKKYLAGDIKPQEQDHRQATYCKFTKKEHGLIDWQQPADYIEKMTRAYYPWPSAYAKLNLSSRLTPTSRRRSGEISKTSRYNGTSQGVRLSSAEVQARGDLIIVKIIKAHVGSIKSELKPGTLFKTANNELAVACGVPISIGTKADGNNSILIIDELQTANKKKMTSAEFLRGHNIV